MSATLWNPSPSPFFQSDGQFASGAKASFYNAGTTTPLTVYQNSTLTTPHSAPVFASSLGVFPAIFLPFGDYRVRIVDQNAALIYDADGISNSAPPASGGGIVVTSDMVLQTGDPVWRLRIGIMAGFVRMNAKTIGSTASVATESANDDTQNLFIFLWSNFTDVDAPVSGGRGASPAADFAANKTIGIPTMQGYLGGGLDDMGGTSAGRLQAITTCTTNGTAVVVVVSAAGLVVGQNAIVNAVGGRTITAIVGTSITLSSVVSGSASGISFRSSFFSDATIMASAAGLAAISQTTNQMPVHNHAITDPGHTHNEQQAASGATFALTGSAAFTFNNTIATTSSTTGITINNTVGGNPMNNLPPMRLGTFYMKK